MLEIRPIMNSCVEEIFGFKTCCGLTMFDQNLEIHVQNRGDRPISVQSLFDVIGPYGTKRVATLIPSGPQRIEPGEMVAFYCSMDEDLWKASELIVFYDKDERAYATELT